METFGPSYQTEHDEARLESQRERIRILMLSANACSTWLTLSEIETLLHCPPASVSAQLRHLRKQEFGGYTVEKRPRGDRAHGLWEYRISAPPRVEAIQLSLMEQSA